MTKYATGMNWITHSRSWRLVVIPLLLVAQLALGIHQIQHRLNPDLAAGDDCALCHFASSMAAAPAAPVIVLPLMVVIAIVLLPATLLPQLARAPLPFRSRAPPDAAL